MLMWLHTLSISEYSGVECCSRAPEALLYVHMMLVCKFQKGCILQSRPLIELQWSLYSVTPGLAHKQFIPLWRCKVWVCFCQINGQFSGGNYSTKAGKIVLADGTWQDWRNSYPPCYPYPQCGRRSEGLSALFPEQNQNPRQHRSSDLGPDFKLFNSEPKCLAVLKRLMSPRYYFYLT